MKHNGIFSLRKTRLQKPAGEPQFCALPVSDIRDKADLSRVSRRAYSALFFMKLYHSRTLHYRSLSMLILSDSTQERNEYERERRSKKLNLFGGIPLKKPETVERVQYGTAKRSMQLAEKLQDQRTYCVFGDCWLLPRCVVSFFLSTRCAFHHRLPLALKTG